MVPGRGKWTWGNPVVRGRIYNPLRTALVALAVCAVAVSGIRAGEYHGVQPTTACSDCHSAHASERGQVWTPTEKLLKNTGGEVPLCMSCHDGTDPQAPDIVSSGTAANPSNVVSTQYASKYGSSAGVFQGDYLLSTNPCGHSLVPGALVSAPLSTSYTKAGGLVCSDCHDSHGNGNYRNLVPDPNPNHPGAFSIVLGTNVKESVPVSMQNPNPAAAYDTGNISFGVPNNIGAWCADCHDQLAQNSAGSSPAHFKGHPSEVVIGGVGVHTDVSNWTTPSGQANTGFGTDVGDSSPGIPRLRYGSPSLSNSTAGSGDAVFCLSCHKAHGSKYKYGLVWPLHQAGSDMLSGCQQCHFK